ncbi:hypothetical protein SAMN05216275_108245 [Streptosporangium canum]|uniref:Uncharacterized protein n=1 Tax=Streptosporangium canum TaxID=324952 RepID=A0A1I3R0V0_9ACTN|nr:hypothetical protein [Streptosporangium canum]SFJ40114.1 hypothetical protein SAMN05216275_108245 [Streptosporangium canum]
MRWRDVRRGGIGHGFELAPAWGGHVARLLVGDGVDPRPAAFAPSGFETGAEPAARFGAARILGQPQPETGEFA